MGVVYLAEQTSLGRMVALKVMSESVAKEDPKFVERFVREAKITAGLRHPNVITVYDSGQIDGCCYMTMDYIAGGSLEDRLAKEKLTHAKVLSIVRDIASGLSCAHDAGLVHRDIKPANVLLESDDTAVITDFGIVKISDGSTTELTGSNVIGSMSYMSPEQLLGEPKIDGGADLYSLGIVLFEMLEGRKPFVADQSYAVGMMHLNDPPPPLSPQNARFQNVVSTLLQKEREDRYRSANHLVVALDELPAEAAAPTTQIPKPLEAPKKPRPRQARDEKETNMRPAVPDYPQRRPATAAVHKAQQRYERTPFRAEGRVEKEPGLIVRFLGSRFFKFVLILMGISVGLTLWSPEFRLSTLGLEWNALTGNGAEKVRIAERFASLGMHGRERYWLSRAAKANQPGASYRLALAYRYDDEASAIKALTEERSNRSEDHWDSLSAIMLSQLLCNNLEVEDCKGGAEALREEAETHRDRQAMTALGVMLLDVPQVRDYEASRQWLLEATRADSDGPATDQVSELAMEALSRIFAEGLGVQADAREATMWLARAAQYRAAKSSTRLKARELCGNIKNPPEACVSLLRNRT